MYCDLGYRIEPRPSHYEELSITSLDPLYANAADRRQSALSTGSNGMSYYLTILPVEKGSFSSSCSESHKEESLYSEIKIVSVKRSGSRNGHARPEYYNTREYAMQNIYPWKIPNWWLHCIMTDEDDDDYHNNALMKQIDRHVFWGKEKKGMMSLLNITLDHWASVAPFKITLYITD